MGLLKRLQQSKEAEKLATAESVSALAWGNPNLSKQLLHPWPTESKGTVRGTPPALAFKASATLNLQLTEITFIK